MRLHNNQKELEILIVEKELDITGIPEIDVMIHDVNANITGFCIFKKGRLCKKRVDRRNIVHMHHSTSISFRITSRSEA